MRVRGSLLALMALAACSVGEPAVVSGLGGELDPAETLRQDGEQAGADLVAQVEVDAQIDETAASIAGALHQGELEIGAPAAERATDFDVHELAERAIRAHRAAGAELDDLCEARDITRRETEVGVRLGVEASASAQKLATMPRRWPRRRAARQPRARGGGC